MRLETYLENREDNIYSFAEAFEELVRADKVYDEATDAEAEKQTDKTEKASSAAFDARNEAAECLVKIIERICGVKRYVVEEE